MFFETMANVIISDDSDSDTDNIDKDDDTDDYVVAVPKKENCKGKTLQIVKNEIKKEPLGDNDEIDQCTEDSVSHNDRYIDSF